MQKTEGHRCNFYVLFDLCLIWLNIVDTSATEININHVKCDSLKILYGSSTCKKPIILQATSPYQGLSKNKGFAIATFTPDEYNRVFAFFG